MPSHLTTTTLCPKLEENSSLIFGQKIKSGHVSDRLHRVSDGSACEFSHGR